jgi:hypothetical protein
LNRRRIGTYNILDGSGNRADGQLDMLTEIELNLLFLTEAMGAEWAEGGELRRAFQSRLGMWSRGRLEPGDGDGRFCVIFGRHGRFRPGTYKPLRTRTRNWRGTGMLEMTTDGYPHTITAMADHGHTLDPDTRLAEATHTARCSITLKAGPAIKAGDYNSVLGRPTGWEHLPEEDIEPDWRGLPTELLPHHVLLDAEGNPVVDADGRLLCDRRPSKVLAIAGFRDAVAELHGPETRPATGGRGPNDVKRRLDRINLRYLTPVDCATLNGPEFANLSDHSLVFTDVDLDTRWP